LNMVNCFGEDELKIEFGKSTEAGIEAASITLKTALADLKEGKIDALVTAPSNGINIALNEEENNTITNETEYIDSIIGEGRKSLKIYASENLRVALATENIPLAQVSQSISKELIAEKIVMLHNSLKRDFYIDNPRIAVLSLNPEANLTNENSEEAAIISPVIEELFKRGVRCFGPYVSNSYFSTDNYKCFDAVLAMYYDQGISPFKALSQNDGYVYNAGISSVITTTTHGVQFDIAGQGKADESSLRHAIYSAIDITRNRNRFDQARRNPLKKQYFEKRDDSDKLKLDQAEED
ncbi:MAG: 4-hydroxythreonine-4-phosphate dehydrogenase PdxA, partial [Prevotellaceae bacterium]|nr:4-hydroxythreonine-4-phosphate dehydrogenase PdxA [Candidatus Minthosoma caballi]